MSALRLTSRWFSRAACVLIGGLLGACYVKDVTPASEYGMPHARFRLDGTVRSRVTGSRIEGIRIHLDLASESALSGPDGRWAMDFSAMPCGETRPCSLAVEDIDGPDHGGTFRNRSVALHLTQTGQGSGWDAGTFEEHGIEIEMDPEGGSKGDH